MSYSSNIQQTSLRLREQLGMLTLTPKKRRALNAAIGKAIVASNRKTIRKSQAPDGTPWKRRKSKRKDKKLSGFAKRLRSHPTADTATITLDKPFSARIAYQHQKGTSWHMTKRSGQRKSAAHDAPCSRFQAVSLRELGYTVRRKQGKRTRTVKPSLKWMQENLTQGQAGIIIRAMGHRSSKTSWTQKTPPRPLIFDPHDPELKRICAEAFRVAGWP
ncbi:phage virion morphogenesis protein [Aeromonas hydrophila]|uniref:phage virion morphogenesis protein n=1 Tax=Aeromonas hydrophila TaxID=644 RepID=UPI00191F3BD9|nr:phage virion morphogenesis protein [Aeromonas hydrophila]MBL0669797.1 phage virion morphogenesis protein [Aeromonas hydrophila]